MTTSTLAALRKQGEPAWKPASHKEPASPDRTGRPLSIDDIFALKLAGDPQVSPDGTRIVVTVQHIDRDSNEYRAALWLYPTGGETPRQLTSGQWNDGSQRWSPDGKSIAFVSKRDTTAGQIWVLPMDGGEARRVTNLDNGVSSPTWSPDGNTIAFSSLVNPEGFDPDHDVRVITSAYYKFDGKGYIDGKRTQIFTVDLTEPDATPVQITSGDIEHGAPAWSPTDPVIAFIANRELNWDVSRTNDLWTIPATGGEPHRLTNGEGSWQSLAWSPDGSRLALIGNSSLTNGYQHNRLLTITADGSDLTCHTTNLDRAISDASMSGPNGPAASISFCWTTDGTAIDALVSDRGSTQVVRFDPESGAATALTARDRHVTGFDHLADDGLVISVTDPTTPAEIRLIRNGSETPLTTFNSVWLAEVAIARPEEFWVESDGQAIQGWLLRPAGNSSTSDTLAPLILNVHGGPNAQFSNAFFHELQMYVARGYALVYINPRGSVGYAEAFADAITARWGTADSPDFLAAIDHVVSLGGIDGDNVGITGGSYGGFVTNWMLGTTDRFRAAVTDRSISNMASMYGTDDIAVKSLDPELGTPWEHPERYWDISPLKYVANITAPLLIVHSENDFRCPMEQAEQLFIALKRLGRKVEFVRFSNESHGLSRNGGPKHRVERLERTLGWFEAHLPVQMN